MQKFGPTPDCPALRSMPEGVDKAHDSWVLEDNVLTRYRVQSRQRLFVPTRVKGVPVPVEQLLLRRETFVTYETGEKFEKQEIISESWRAEDATQPLPHLWTSETVFFLKEEVPAAALEAKTLKPVAETSNGQQGVGSGGSAARQEKAKGYGRFYDFCCTPNSNLGSVSESLGFPCAPHP